MVFKTSFVLKLQPRGPTLFTLGTHLPQPCMYLSVKRRVRSLTQPGCVLCCLSLSFRASGCTAASTASTRPSSSKYLPSAPPHSSSLRMQKRWRLSRCIDAYLWRVCIQPLWHFLCWTTPLQKTNSLVLRGLTAPHLSWEFEFSLQGDKLLFFNSKKFTCRST